MLKRKRKLPLLSALLLCSALAATGCASGDGQPMNAAAADVSPSVSADYGKPVALNGVSPDGTESLFSALNDGFVASWKDKTGQDVTIKQTTGPSSKEKDAVNESALKADFVVLGVGTDIDAIQAKGLVEEGWQQRYDYNSSPFYTTVAFAVRAGNPKGVKNWEDIAAPGVKIVAADPKTYSDARWTYSGAWAYAYDQAADEEAAKTFVRSVYHNAGALDADETAAQARFLGGEGDVWLTTEARALALANGEGKGKIDVVVPSVTLAVEPIVSVVDKNADEAGTRDAANGYADFLFTEPAQQIAAEHYYRPRFASIAEQFASQFPETTVLTVDDNLSGWEDLNSAQFADGGLFEQLTEK